MSDSREFLELHPPEGVVEITRDLERAGFAAWCVGGAVRDALLGHPHLDWDLATDAKPDDVRRIFGRKRTIPVGVEFGTVGVVDRHNVMHEVTTFRRDVRTDGRHAEVEFGVSLEEDLARRDFTINAIAFSSTTAEVRDPFGGRTDLRAGIIRAVGEPSQRMAEDRLRALRGIRFAARFGFELDRLTWEAIRASAPHLTRLSAERVKQELDKTLEQTRAPSHAWRMWRDSGAATVLLPELAAAGDEAMRATDCAAQPGLSRKPGRRLIRLAALFSDTDSRGLSQLASRLRFSNDELKWIRALVERWHALGDAIGNELASGEPEGVVVRRWVSRIGRVELHAFFRLAAARWDARRLLGGAPTPTAQAVHSLYRRALVVARRDPVHVADLAVDGDDLRRAGIAPGPGLGMILTKLLGWVIEDPSRNVRDRLLDEALRLNAEQR